MSDKSSLPKLNNTNYEVWCVLMAALLVRKNLHEVGTGQLAMPATGPNSKGVKDWTRKNAEARAELILHVETDQLAHMTSPNAGEVWAELERVHRARGLATRLSLRRKFLTMTKKTEKPMSQWIADVRSLAFRLRGIGVNVEDEDLILVLTLGLPPSYDTFVVALDATPANQLLLDDVITRLLNEESRHDPEEEKKVAEKKEDPGPPQIALRAYAARSPNTGTAHITCYCCGMKGHFQANCPDRHKARFRKGDTSKEEVAGFASAAAVGPKKATMELELDDDDGW